MATRAMIAALFVEAGGPYYGLPDVDPWDKERDARLYRGPWPVVAHPPCERWGRYWRGSPYAIARGLNDFKKGDDGNCFAAALDAIDRYGGVLEHPADSAAWDAFDLHKPPRSGGWIMANWLGMWTCYVEQGQYGHAFRKPTWLLAKAPALPSLQWGEFPVKPPEEHIEQFGYERARKRGWLASVGGGGNSRERSKTPAPFRNLLLDIARSAWTGREHIMQLG